MSEEIITFRQWVSRITDQPGSRQNKTGGRPRKGMLQPTIRNGWRRRRKGAWDAKLPSVMRFAAEAKDGLRSAVLASTMECTIYALGGCAFYRSASDPKGPIVPMRKLHEVVQHCPPRFHVERDPSVFWQLPIWRMPSWALPGVLGLSDLTVRRVLRGEMRMDLLSHQKWAWGKQLLLYATHPIFGTCRVQLPKDGFNEWAREVMALRKAALGYVPTEEV